MQKHWFIITKFCQWVLVAFKGEHDAVDLLEHLIAQYEEMQ